MVLICFIEKFRKVYRLDEFLLKIKCFSPIYFILNSSLFMYRYYLILILIFSYESNKNYFFFQNNFFPWCCPCHFSNLSFQSFSKLLLIILSTETSKRSDYSLILLSPDPSNRSDYSNLVNTNDSSFIFINFNIQINEGKPSKPGSDQTSV